MKHRDLLLLGVLDEDVIKLEIRVFEDDLRDALRNMTGHVVHPDHEDLDSLVFRYFSQHFLAYQDEDQALLEFTSNQLIGDSYEILFQIVDFKSGRELQFRIDYLLELFPTQQNILQIRNEKNQFYNIFKKGELEWSVEL